MLFQILSFRFLKESSANELAEIRLITADQMHMHIGKLQISTSAVIAGA